LAGYWLILPALLSAVFFWLLARNKSVFWSASGLLLATILVAAFGIMLGLSSILMLIACTTALMSWDLIQFTHSTSGPPPGATLAPLERYHLQSLVLAALPGSLLAIVISYISLDLPFVAIILLALIAMAGLGYGMQTIVKKNR